MNSETTANVPGVDDQSQLTASGGPIYVFGGMIRAWHWITALCVIVLAITGYVIASPLPTMPGEASESFLMGYLRFAHFAAGYVFAAIFIGRIYLALVGNRHARQIFYLPLLQGAWWRGMWVEMKWYMFLAKSPRKCAGHNPLGHLTIFVMFTLLSVFMILTGGALYAEGAGAASWQEVLFGWVRALFGDSQTLRTWHHLGMWAMVIFFMLHLYAVIREEIMSRQSMLSTMISGERTFRDDLP